MLPTNNSERSKKLQTFGLFYGLSVAAICIIVFAFTDGLGGKEPMAENKTDDRSAQMVFSADSLLHKRMTTLESVDNYYNVALASVKTRAGARTADSFHRLVPVAEQDFQFALDSVSRLGRKTSNSGLQQTADFFATALGERAKRLAGPRVSTDALPASLQSAPVTMSADELIKNNPELKEQMLKKDIRIADLETSLAQLKKSGSDKTSPAAEAAGVAASRKLQEDFEALQKNNKSLTETNIRLRNAATQAAADNASTATAETEAAKAARAKNLKMEQQLQALNADLSFSTVDCNLSRADVNQIIYNGKQRKVLLQQALDILTPLKKSSDDEVQKRAMQKISQLNRIAMTVRD